MKKNRLKRELEMNKVTSKGYSRNMANVWRKKTREDARLYKNVYPKDYIEDIHKRGYLCRSVERYDLFSDFTDKYISDFEYIFLAPYNNQFSKWLDDMLTTRRVLKKYEKHHKEIYFSIIHREKRMLILSAREEDREYTYQDIFDLVKEVGVAELRPSHWNSKRSRYTIKYVGEEEGFLINETAGDLSRLRKIIGSLKANYVVAEPTSFEYDFGEGNILEHYIKFWIANDAGEKPIILEADMANYYTEVSEKGEKKGRKHEVQPIDLESGSCNIAGKKVVVPNWDYIKETIEDVGKQLYQLNYFTVNIALSEEKGFVFLNFSADPRLPEITPSDKLNSYLKDKAQAKLSRIKYTFGDRIKEYRRIMKNKRIMSHAREGIRPYMQKLWIDSVKDDFWHTKNVSLSKKIWAWKRGFLSFRTYQYGLNESNYRYFLSDYDYHWLNRINNDYQKWVNDKTTFRYMLEPFKDYIPKYYFSIFKRTGKGCISKMWDCPDYIEESVSGIVQLLKEKGKLALKASAGTHGDGFYCLAYSEGEILVNDEVSTEADLQKLIDSFTSFYILTEYIEQSDVINQIYGKSVNTIRMMVINADGYNPKIMQTYMRIGSSKTGFTDNVGYGGICAMIDRETGELYNPETITDHVFNPCPVHPDTGTKIEGKIPHWEDICEQILGICRYLCELEYLGFDVAITKEGFQIIEINIHQDLHKVASFDNELREFFRRKIAEKYRTLERKAKK